MGENPSAPPVKAYSVVSVPLPPELVSLYTEPKLELLPLVVP
jgi:hypothetical protein